MLSAFVVRPLAGLSDFMSARLAAASDTCLDRIPAQAPVAASGRLIPHLSHRRVVVPLSRLSGQPYLALAHYDSHDTKLAAQPSYRVVCRRGAVTVLENRRQSRSGSTRAA